MFRKAQIPLAVILGLLICSCRPAERETRIEIQLNSSWMFREVGTNVWFPAQVPGTVASDIDKNNKRTKEFVYHLSDIPRSAWEYRTTFDVAQEMMDQDVIQLYFKGIDSHANVYLNDSLLFRANDKYRTWLVSCKEGLKAKGNVLSVIFQHHSGRKRDSSKNTVVENIINDEPAKTFTNIGICKPVYLQAWSAAKISGIYLRPDSITPKRAVYTADISVLSIENQSVTLEVMVNNKLTSVPVNIKLTKGSNNYHSRIVIDKPKFWWANGSGNPNVYMITVRLKRDHETICEVHQRLGVRTMEITTPSSSPNNGYYLKLNGVPVFAKGAVYSSCYQLGNEEERQKQLIESARLSNFNILRVKTYEDDSFYDLCDENGIMVWQDFPVRHIKTEKDSSCSEKLKQEVVENIKRLRNHACIAFIWGSPQGAIASDKGTFEPFQHKFFNEILPIMLKEQGCLIAYISETQLADVKQPINLEAGNGRVIGNMMTDYGIPSFGFNNNSKASSNPVVGTQQFTDGNSVKSDKSLGDAEAYMQQNFQKPKDAESQTYITWITQAEMLKSSIDNHRLQVATCMGSIYQQLNDCKGGLSFSTIDSSGKWKPAQYTIQDAFSHIHVIPQRNKGLVNIYVVSDALKDLDAFLLVKLIDFYGNDLFVRQIPIDIKANSSTFLFSVREAELLKNADKASCCLVVQVNQATKTLSQNTLYFTALKNLFQPRYTVSFDVNDAVKGYNLILRSSVLVKNLVISTGVKDCWFSDNNIDLLPGKRTKINVRYQGTKTELLKDLRFKSLADIK